MPGTPLFMQAGSGDAAINYSAQDFRKIVQALTGGQERPLTPTAFQVAAQPTPNFTVSVGAGQAVVQGDNITDQGYYLCSSTAADTLTVPAAPATGSRTHRIVLQVRDKLHGAYTDYAWESVLLPDTGAGTPSIPASALPLARVTVAAGQASVTNANIADDRPLSIDLTSLGAGFQTYTPVITSSTTNPNLGTGATAIGTYSVLGLWVLLNIKFILGTGPTPGSGSYSVSLPPNYPAPTGASAIPGTFYPTSTGGRIPVSGVASGATLTRINYAIYNPSPSYGLSWGSTGPSAIGSGGTLPLLAGDTILFTGIYPRF